MSNVQNISSPQSEFRNQKLNYSNTPVLIIRIPQSEIRNGVLCGYLLLALNFISLMAA